MPANPRAPAASKFRSRARWLALLALMAIGAALVREQLREPPATARPVGAPAGVLAPATLAAPVVAETELAARRAPEVASAAPAQPTIESRSGVLVRLADDFESPPLLVQLLLRRSKDTADDPSLRREGELRAGSQAHFDDLIAGDWKLRSSLGHDLELTVTDGQLTEVVLDGREQIRRSVHVTDGQGVPLADAVIEVAGFEVGTTDAQGHCGPLLLRAGEPVAATAPGRARALSPVVTPSILDPIPIHCPHRGVRLQVQVLLSDGAVGAPVLVDVQQLFRPPDPAAPTPSFGQPLRTFAAGSGEERVLSGLQPGAWLRVAATAPGHASEVVALQLRAPEVERLVLQLDRGGTVVGRVTEGGRAVADAYVGLYPFGPFGNRATRSDDQGRFRMEHVAAGDRRLEALYPGRKCSAVEEVTITAGATTTWNPELDCGASIAGRLLNADGSPRADTRMVLARPETPNVWLDFDTTAGDGSFALDAAELTGNLVFAQTAEHVELARLENVAGNSSGIELRIEGQDPILRLRVVDPQGQVRSDGWLWAAPIDNLGSFAWSAKVGADGTAVGRVGTLLLSVRHADFGIIPLGEVTMAAASDIDLGAAEFQLPGWIELRAAKVDGSWSARYRVSFSDGQTAGSSGVAELGGLTLIGPLQPGALSVHFQPAAASEPIFRQVTVIAGEIVPLAFD